MNEDSTVKLPLMIVSILASLTANTALRVQQSFYLEQLSSRRHVQGSAGGAVKCNSEEGAQSPQYRRLPHGFADFVQFCPLLTASR